MGAEILASSEEYYPQSCRLAVNRRVILRLLELLATARKQPVRIPSGKQMTPREMVRAIKKSTAHWNYDVVSIGYPGKVVRGRPAEDAPNLGKGWVDYDFKKAFGRPDALTTRKISCLLCAIRAIRGEQLTVLQFEGRFVWRFRWR
jgi:hypothetical protein